jgi:mannose-6-phosphate isomerase-like protein (cupin superfamily)
MSLVAKSAKGLERLLVDEALPADRLTLHISEVGPGARAHPPHTHAGIEGFYILEGQGVVEVGEERHPLAAGEAALLDASTLHGLVNAGPGPLRYMVIIARP